jgi:hypothetical protein
MQRVSEHRLEPHLERLLLAAAALCIALLLLVLCDFEYGRDQGIYAVVARTLLEGGAPYQDAWDFKPPMIFFVYGLARGLLGAEVHAIRLLEAASFASLVWAFLILSRRHLGSARPGWIAGLLAVSAHVQLEFWHTGQPESFGAVVTAWALVCATFEPAPGDGAERRRWLAGFAAGGLYTVAALLKPPLGGGFLVSLAFALRGRHAVAGSRGLLSPLSAYAAGASAVLAGVALFFLAHGAWPELSAALFGFAPRYTALSLQAGDLRSLVYRALDTALFHYSAHLPLGIALLLALPPLDVRERRGAAHVAGVCGLQVIGIGLQAKFFSYHFGATVPLLALLAGWGLWKLWLRVRPRPLVAVATLLALFALADVHLAKPSRSGLPFWQRAQLRLGLGTAADSPALRDRLHSLPDYDAAANRRVADWLREHTDPDDSVYLWGFEPVIYELADRRCASRYIYNVPQRLPWPGRAAARRELVAELRADPPAVFIVARGDDFRLVTGNRRDSEAELAGFAPLRELLERDYRRERRIGSFTLHVRRAGGGAGAPGG